MSELRPGLDVEGIRAHNASQAAIEALERARDHWRAQYSESQANLERIAQERDDAKKQLARAIDQIDCEHEEVAKLRRRVEILLKERDELQEDRDALTASVRVLGRDRDMWKRAAQKHERVQAPDAVAERIRPSLIVGRNCVALVRKIDGDVEPLPPDTLPPIVLVGTVSDVRAGKGAALYTRGEAVALASALEAVATELPIE